MAPGLKPKDAEALLPQAKEAVSAAQELLNMLQQAAEGQPIEPLKLLLASSNAAQKALSTSLAVTFDAK